MPGGWRQLPSQSALLHAVVVRRAKKGAGIASRLARRAERTGSTKGARGRLRLCPGKAGVRLLLRRLRNLREKRVLLLSWRNAWNIGLCLLCAGIRHRAEWCLDRCRLLRLLR